MKKQQLKDIVTTGKLKLSSERIRVLAGSDLTKVAGGGSDGDEAETKRPQTP